MKGERFRVGMPSQELPALQEVCKGVGWAPENRTLGLKDPELNILKEAELGLTEGQLGLATGMTSVSTLSRPFQPSTLLSHLHLAGPSALTGKAIPTPK